MEEYVIEPLARSAILNAYPLIQLTDPHMSLRAWKTRALAAIGRRGSGEHGILVAANAASARVALPRSSARRRGACWWPAT